MKVLKLTYMRCWLAGVLFLLASGTAKAQNHVVSGGDAAALSPINLTNANGWSTARTATPGFFSAIAPGGIYLNATDVYHINGYVRHEPGTTGQGFRFPVGDGADLRELSTGGTIAADISYATAWIKGNPSITADPTDPAPGFHNINSKEPAILEVSALGQWDWVELTGSTAGMMVTVSIPENTFKLYGQCKSVKAGGLGWC